MKLQASWNRARQDQLGPSTFLAGVPEDRLFYDSFDCAPDVPISGA